MVFLRDQHLLRGKGEKQDWAERNAQQRCNLAKRQRLRKMLGSPPPPVTGWAVLGKSLTLAGHSTADEGLMQPRANGTHHVLVHHSRHCTVQKVLFPFALANVHEMRAHPLPPAPTASTDESFSSGLDDRNAFICSLIFIRCRSWSRWSLYSRIS